MSGVLTGLCLYMVGIRMTVEKWAKRMPDITVKTTDVKFNLGGLIVCKVMQGYS